MVCVRRDGMSTTLLVGGVLMNGLGSDKAMAQVYGTNHPFHALQSLFALSNSHIAMALPRG